MKLHLAACLSAAFLAATAQAEPAENAPDLKGVTLICQEWHNWFYSACGAAGQDVEWWGDNCWIDDKVSEVSQADPYRSFGPLWQRFLGASRVYPMIGPYSSANPEALRWQLRLMKASGFDGTLFHLYPEPKEGKAFCNLDALKLSIAIAEEEGYKFGVQDEIQFMPQSAKGVDAFIERASSALAILCESRKALLEMDGMPVYQFEAFLMQGWTAQDFERMMQGVEGRIGRKVYWMSAGPASLLLKIPSLRCFKWPSNTVFKAENLGKPKTYGYGGSTWTALSDGEALPAEISAKWKDALADCAKAAEKAGKDFAPWLYPGFVSFPHYLPRDGGEQLLLSTKEALLFKPKAINFAAWNERIEKSYFEPSWSVDDPDPYHWLKLVAKMKGIEFKAPPLPPKECVDPFMWSVLYGIDRTPPRVIGARLHPAEMRVSADCIDDMSGVAELRVSSAPLARVLFKDGSVSAQACKASVKEGSLDAAKGGLWLQEGKAVISLEIPAAAAKSFEKACAALRLKVPEGLSVKISPKYPCGETPSAKYRVNGWSYSRVPKAPTVFGGDEGFVWQPLTLGTLKAKEGEDLKLSFVLELKREESAPKDAALVTSELAIFPAELPKAIEGSFAYPAPDACVRTFVSPTPPELDRKSLFESPLALQCVDKEGNVSPVQVTSAKPARKWLTQNLKLYYPPLDHEN